MEYTQMKVVETRRFYLGSIFFIEVIQTGTAGTEIWIGRDRDRKAFYQGYHGLIFEDMSDAKLKAWIEMDRVLEIVNSQLSDPGEQWIIDESGAIDEAHKKEYFI